MKLISDVTLFHEGHDIVELTPTPSNLESLLVDMHASVSFNRFSFFRCWFAVRTYTNRRDKCFIWNRYLNKLPV